MDNINEQTKFDNYNHENYVEVKSIVYPPKYNDVVNLKKKLKILKSITSSMFFNKKILKTFSVITLDNI